MDVGFSLLRSKSHAQIGVAAKAPQPIKSAEEPSAVRDTFVPEGLPSTKASETFTESAEQAPHSPISIESSTSKSTEQPLGVLLLENPISPEQEKPQQTFEQTLKEAAYQPSHTTLGNRLKNFTAGLSNGVQSAFGGGDPTFRLKQEKNEILALEAKYSAKDPSTGKFLIPDLSVKTKEFRELLKSGKATLDDIRADAYAVAREASARTLGMRHYECQILGALAMDGGSIAEMKTGEGKTLTAVLPLYLNALATDDEGQGKGAHLITVNETLARRDAEEMGPVFESLGLSVGIVTEDLSPQEKQAAYAADVTYTTNTNIGFDYLRDQMVASPGEKVQRGLHYALIDEVDQVLIDEASTPLILSAGDETTEAEYRNFANLVRGLDTSGLDFLINNKDRTVEPTDEGLRYIETHLAFQDAREDLLASDHSIGDGSPLAETYSQAEASLTALKAWRREKNPIEAEKLKTKFDEAYEKAPSYNLYAPENVEQVNLFENALQSEFLFHEGEDYLVLNGEVKIVDQFKGRTPEGRRYSNGLHQALEAKEGVVIKKPTRTIASVTYPSLFKLYNGVAGMSGTALSEAEEFQQLYGLEVVPIPTNKPVILEKKDTLYFETEEEKFAAVADEAQELFEQGKPVLIGTVSVENNEKVANLLRARGIPAQVLNAKSVKESTDIENQRIAQAGRSGMVTVATNMAGRGVNIRPDWIAYSKLSNDVMREALPLGRMASHLEKLNEDGLSGLCNFGNPETAQAVAGYFRGQGLEVELSDDYPGFLKVGTSEELQPVNVSGFPARPAVVDVKDEKELEKLRSWFDKTGMPVQVTQGAAEAPPAGTVQIRVLPTDASRKDPNSYENPIPRARVPEGVAYFPAENYFTGGLQVLATEAHDSPRIDRQLVGRAGRQGAPGWYQFFLSLEDKVLKHFGGDKLTEAFRKASTNPEPSQGVSSPTLDKLVSKAQEKVSGRQFEQRQNMAKFDLVNDPQRSLFYELRTNLVETENLPELLEDWTTRHVLQDLKSSLPSPLFFGWKDADVQNARKGVEEEFGFALPLAFNPELPITPDYLEKVVSRAIKERFEAMDEHSVEATREEILADADRAWSQHLEALELLQTNVNLETLAQKDPDLRYKERAWESFGQFHRFVERDSIKKLSQEFQGHSVP